jgi:hypothetical protein
MRIFRRRCGGHLEETRCISRIPTVYLAVDHGGVDLVDLKLPWDFPSNTIAIQLYARRLRFIWQRLA